MNNLINEIAKIGKILEEEENAPRKAHINTSQENDTQTEVFE